LKRSRIISFMNTAVYVRVSTDHQRTDSQEQELKRYCRQRGWTNPTFFTDRISGAKTSRPELDKLMHRIRGGEVERLVVYKLDRLGRSLTHLALILDELNRLQVPLIVTSQGIDTSDANPAGRLQLGVLMAVAEFERGMIRERVQAGLRAARARGTRLGRPGTLQSLRSQVQGLTRLGLGIRAIARKLQIPVGSAFKLVKGLRAGGQGSQG